MTTARASRWLLAMLAGCGGTSGLPTGLDSDGESSSSAGAAPSESTAEGSTETAADVTDGTSDAGGDDGSSDDTTSPDADESTSAASDTGGGGDLEDFLSVYIVGQRSVGPGGLGGLVGLRARPSDVAILSDGDFIVFGEEEYNAGGLSGIVELSTVYRFSGANGDLVWKDVDGVFPSVNNNVLALLGVGSDDGSYLAEGLDGGGRISVTKVDADGNVDWQTTDDVHAQIDDEFVTLAGDYYNRWVSGGIVTDDDLAVVTLSLSDISYDESHSVFVAVSDEDTYEFVTSQPDSSQVIAPVQVAADELVTAAVGADGMSLILLTVELPTGTITSLPIDASGYAAGPLFGQSDYEPGWWPIELHEASGTDLWLLAGESYLDVGGSRQHVFRIGLDGEVLDHVALEPDAGEDTVSNQFYWSMSVTPEGVLVVGAFDGLNTWTQGSALLYDVDDLASPPVSYELDELDGYLVEWTGVATRDDRTIMVGEIEGLTTLLHGTVFGD